MRTNAQDSPALKFSVLLVYEDLEMGLHAKRVFDLIAQVSREEVDTQLSVLRFDCFNSPELAGDGFHHAAEADIIVLAPRNSEDLPAPTKQWLESLPERRGVPGGAMVAVFSPDSDPNVESSAAAKLAMRVAERAEMDFFVRPGKPPVLHTANFVREGPLVEAVCPEL